MSLPVHQMGPLQLRHLGGSICPAWRCSYLLQLLAHSAAVCWLPESEMTAFNR